MELSSLEAADMVELMGVMAFWLEDSLGQFGLLSTPTVVMYWSRQAGVPSLPSPFNE